MAERAAMQIPARQQSGSLNIAADDDDYGVWWCSPCNRSTVSTYGGNTALPPASEKTGISLCLGDFGNLGDYVVYTFYLGLRQYSWRVRLRFSDATRALDACERVSRRRSVRMPSVPRRTWRFHETEGEAIEHRSRHLTRYLSAAVAHRQVWEHCLELRELLEVGATSFEPGLGPKCKEGYLTVSVGSSLASVKWVTLKTSYVALYERSDSPVASVVLTVDSRFGFELNEAKQSIVVDAGGRRVSLRAHRRMDGRRRIADWLEAFEIAFGRRPRYAKPKLTASPQTSAGDQPWERQLFRYESFVPPRRNDTVVDFIVSGRDYFLHVLAALQSARRSVFVADWRINPKLLLERGKRKVALNEVLQKCVERGCVVCVLLYREFSESLQSKHRSAEIAAHLQSIGVRCIRHPKHLSAGQVFWTHHEKLVVVDQRLAFVGGMDLVEGRYCETERRRLKDDGVSWPGIEFYQPNAPRRGPIDRSSTPRQPWQDVAVKLRGAAALDVALHFVQRWNHHRLALRCLDEPVLLPSSDAPGGVLDEDGDEVQQDPFSLASPEVQVIRSAGRWSLSLDRPERSVCKAWCDAIASARSSIYIEQQFFITTFEHTDATPRAAHNGSAGGGGGDKSAMMECSDEPTLVVVPPGVSEGESFVIPVDERRWVTVEVPRGCGPGSTLYVQHPRNSPSVVQSQRRPAWWSDGALLEGIEYLAAAKTTLSAVAANVAMPAQQRNDVGAALLDRLRRAIADGEDDFKVLIMLPLHPNGRFLDSYEVRAVMQQQFASLCRGPTSLLGRLKAEFPDVDPFDYLALCSLRAWDNLDNGPASEMVYVHSKCLIVDDELAIVGSANVNDRSMLGDRDSEVAVVVADPSKVAAFRRRLWRIHAGTSYDPSWEEMVRIATKNTAIFEHAFDGKPWNDIATFYEAKQLVGLSRLSVRLASSCRRPEHGRSVYDGAASILGEIRTSLKEISGSICLFPLNFLSAETLAPSALSKLVVGRRLYQ